MEEFQIFCQQNSFNYRLLQIYQITICMSLPPSHPLLSKFNQPSWMKYLHSATAHLNEEIQLYWNVFNITISPLRSEMQAHMVGAGWFTQMTSYRKSSELPKIFRGVVSFMTCTNLHIFQMSINQIISSVASSWCCYDLGRISFASLCIFID